MYRLLLLIEIVLLVGALPAFSQFMVTASTPVDGAEGVAIVTTISFTFSQPLDTAMRFSDTTLPINISLNTSDSLTFVSYTSDLMTIRLDVKHGIAQDRAILISGAKSKTGEMLTQPYVLNYTTASAHANLSVSGVVIFDGGDPTNAVVGLADRSPFQGGQNIMYGSIVANSSGNYVMRYVRDGVYWPISSKDVNGDGRIDPSAGDPIGFYDPNHDGAPDSLVVSGGDISNIELKLVDLFAPSLARTYLTAAIGLAAGYASDQELRAIVNASDSVGLTGRSVFWLYYFYSPSKKFPTRVSMSSFATNIDTTMDHPVTLPTNMRSIPPVFVDSDVPLAAAESHGGSTFRSSYDTIPERRLFGGNLWWAYPADTTRLIWVVEYKSAPVGSGPRFIAITDMLTGTFLIGGEIASAEDISSSASDVCSLLECFPNPVIDKAAIRFRLERSAHVRLTVFDALGREVNKLIDANAEPGDHVAMFDASALPAGTYWYRLEANKSVLNGRMVVR